MSLEYHDVLAYCNDIEYNVVPAYGNLPEHLKTISFGIENERRKGCTWLVNGETCKKPCMPFIMYCSEHKNIPDIKRVIHEPITTCIKRKKTDNK